jgi:hypothetical protein
MEALVALAFEPRYGQPRIAAELRALIRRMWRENLCARRPAHTADELSLSRDELLAKQPVLGDERDPSTEQIGREPSEKPNAISHNGLP